MLTVRCGPTQSFAGKRWCGPRGTQPTTPPLSQNCPQNIDGWTVTNCALMAQNCPLLQIKISAKESCRRRYLLPFICFKVSHERNPFLAPIRAIFCISNPPCASLALYTGWSFVSPLISSIICPVAMKEYLHLALTEKGESLISHKIAIKLLNLPIQHQI